MVFVNSQKAGPVFSHPCKLFQKPVFTKNQVFGCMDGSCDSLDMPATGGVSFASSDFKLRIRAQLFLAENENSIFE